MPNVKKLISLEKSFASHHRSAQWSDKNELKPHEVAKFSNARYWFDCIGCNHCFDARLSSIANGRWCSYCNGDKICNNPMCEHCLKKSFAGHPKSIYWNIFKNNNLTPREISKSSPTKYWFDCNKCNHCFDISLNHITSERWCPYCSGNKICNSLNCNYCFEKSFASNPRSIQWSVKNNNIMPRDVSRCNGKKYWFNCDKCNYCFNSQISSIANGHWCPACINKTETLLYDFIKQTFNSAIKCFKVDWCKNRRHLPFDIAIPDLKIIIELDGPQHFKQIYKRQCPKETQKTDIYKMNCAIKNNYFVIRLLQEDVLYNKYDWKLELIDTINNLIGLKHVHVVYMCKNNEYDVYDQDTVDFDYV
jgi:very-short-patch-repair endonuclease